MNISTQLSLLNIPEPSKTYDINRLDGTRAAVVATNSRGSASAALAARIVDDRVLHMGMTNWKAVIDRALDTGHTELFDSDHGRQGLRKHGYRYSPLPLLPERAVEYVKGRVLSLGANKLTKKVRDRLGCTSGLANAKHLTVTVIGNGIDVFVAEGAHLTSIQVIFDQIVFSDGSDADDIKVLGKQLATALKRQASNQGLILKLVATDSAHIGRCVLAQLAKIQELAAWNA